MSQFLIRKLVCKPSFKWFSWHFLLNGWGPNLKPFFGIKKGVLLIFNRPWIGKRMANMLNKIPKIHIKSFKTVDARASGLHFTTPFWAWSWPWRWYQKLPIITFSGKQEIYNITKNQLSRHYGVLSRAQKPIFRPLFGVPWGPIMTYPKFDPTIL